MSMSFFKKKTYVGLDIGSSTIAAVQIEPASGGWRVVRSGVAETPLDAVREGVVTDPDAAAMAIKAAMRQGRISATSAVIGVSGGSVIVRTVRIPKMPEATLRKSIKFEAGRYVPSSIEDSFIEFEVIGEAPDGEMDVLIVAAPREIVESRVRACERAGLEVEIVDIEAFAMFRALIEASQDPSLASETIAVIDVGYGATTVSVVSHGVFALTRSIPLAGSTLTEALKTHFRLGREDAEEGKRQLDLSLLLDRDAAAENAPLRVIQPHVDELVREIRRSLNYYQSQQTEAGRTNPVTRIVLCGGTAQMPGLGAYFEHRLGMPVTASGAFDNTQIEPCPDSNESGLTLAVATGLAMRPFSKSA